MFVFDAGKDKNGMLSGETKMARTRARRMLNRSLLALESGTSCILSVAEVRAVWASRPYG